MTSVTRDVHHIISLANCISVTRAMEILSWLKVKIESSFSTLKLVQDKNDSFAPTCCSALRVCSLISHCHFQEYLRRMKHDEDEIIQTDPWSVYNNDLHENPQLVATDQAVMNTT